MCIRIVLQSGVSKVVYIFAFIFGVICGVFCMGIASAPVLSEEDEKELRKYINEKAGKDLQDL